MERLLDSEGRELARKLTKYAYDDNGNQLRQSVSHILPDSTKLRPSTKGTAYGDELEGEIDSLIEKTSYTYDGFNRLTDTETIKAGERTTAEYAYDGDDLRVSKTVRKSRSGYKAEVTNYLYDRQNVILETDAEGNTRASYVKGINYISKTDGTGKDSYYLFNGHGDVVQTVDAAGSTQNQYEYDIWGNPVLTIEASENAIRYAGEFLDSETGLYYLRARFYDPYIGRFTTEDSYWGEDENPLSLNLYTYCANDPVRYVDPSGHVWMYNAGGRLQDIEQKDVSGATQVGYSLAKDVTMYNSGGLSSQVAVGDISRAEQVGFVLPQLIYNSTDTVNVSSGVVINYSNIQNMNVAANAQVFIENRGFIDTLFSDKGSSMTLDNYGKIRAVNIGEGARANIFNYNQEKDPETNEYIKSIEVITGGLKSNINLFNYGGVGEVHTGDYSENLVYNGNEEAYVNWLETGLDNTTAVDMGIKNITGLGKIAYAPALDLDSKNIDKSVEQIRKIIKEYGKLSKAQLKQAEDFLNTINTRATEYEFKQFVSALRALNLTVRQTSNTGRYVVENKESGNNEGNFDDIVKNIEALEKLCVDYYGYYNILPVMSIIRRKYDNNKWKVMAGSVPNDFEEYIKKSNPALLKYFSDKGEGAWLIDPVTNEKIDFQHMIVSAETIYNVRAPLFADLASWAGDLQQVIGELQKYQKDKKIADNVDDLSKVAKQIIGDNTGKFTDFTMGDMLADIDAYNIGISLKSSSKLSEVIKDYYSNGVSSRYTNFVNNNHGIDKLQIKTNNYTTNASWGGPIYTDILNDNKIKNSKITNNQLKALNIAFMDFIKANMSKEKH